MDLADLRLPERGRRIPDTSIPGLPASRPPLPSRTPPARPRAQHRPLDDETQPHLLLTEAFTGRPSAGGLRLPGPGRPGGRLLRPRPAVPARGAQERLSSV
jgi:hypothetical protein